MIDVELTVFPERNQKDPLLSVIVEIATKPTAEKVELLKKEFPVISSPLEPSKVAVEFDTV